MDQSVDTRFDLHESAIVGNARNGCSNDRARRIFLCRNCPRVGLELFYAERYFLLILIYIENDNFDLIIQIEHIGRVSDPFRPAHLADMNQSFDAFFKSYKSAIVHNVNDSTFDTAADRIPVFNRCPGTLSFLLETERYLFMFLVNADDDAFDFLVKVNNFRRMTYPAPTQVRDVQKTVKAAEINEYTEVGDILDDTLAYLTFFDFLKQFIFTAATFVFDEFSSGYDNVAIFGIDLEYLALNILPDETADVAWFANVNLRSRQKYRNSDVDQQAALDPSRNLAGYNVAFCVCLNNSFPTAYTVGFSFAK